ncbi:MAG TPA: GGDEF domain-containing protein [Burkholderiaceae bacterium]|nr:GGDEF domain-containing protein [Burkholderiaceae bacterium]
MPGEGTLTALGRREFDLPLGPRRDSRVAPADCEMLLRDLNALQTTLLEERDRAKRLERVLIYVQGALARSRAELAATRNGARRARHLALHDSLTGLPNRRCFGERLDRAVAQVRHASHGLAVFYVDLDGLKAINDRHGHNTGDALLKIVASRLRAALRAHDVVSRLGGDEFACLLTGLLNRGQLAHLACKLFDTVSAPVQIGDRGLVVRASIGIVTCPADGNTEAALLNHADTAMYCAKREQTGYAFFSEPPEGQIVGLAGKTMVARTPAPTNSRASAIAQHLCLVRSDLR